MSGFRDHNDQIGLGSWILQHAPARTRDDEDVVLAALQCSDSFALRFASLRMRTSIPVCVAAIQRNRKAFRFVAPELATRVVCHTSAGLEHAPDASVRGGPVPVCVEMDHRRVLVQMDRPRWHVVHQNFPPREGIPELIVHTARFDTKP